MTITMSRVHLTMLQSVSSHCKTLLLCVIPEEFHMTDKILYVKH